MSGGSGLPLGFAEALDLPLSVDLRTAARAFAICPATAYKLIRLGAFPCPVLRVGGQYRIPTAYLLSTLGIEERPVYAVPLENDTAPAAQPHDIQTCASEVSE
ncbi:MULTISPECIES: helix-turn-helix domain-containing protein [unclassified Streptomyces]|uniref:helix-turn-helix domain-containing protein n=1 Tax=unclassified Streptomyces TaxID=2593676 RepID=UPI000DD9ADBE|nr:MULTISPECIES: helix-turn-helix domain-containing protein [unclassified Streptomyces]QZZ26377.1 DNA-binding protein [Streptomyces sp. ST1015]